MASTTTPGDAFLDVAVTFKMTPQQQAGWEDEYGLEPGMAVADITGRLREVITDCLFQGGGLLPGFLSFSVAEPRVTSFADDPVTAAVLEAVPAHFARGPASIAVLAGVDLVTALPCLGLLAGAGFVRRCGQGWVRCASQPAAQ